MVQPRGIYQWSRAGRQISPAQWKKELDYRLKKELWCFRNNRMAARFEYEWHDGAGQWFRPYGNELWELDELGYMKRRFACINDLAIKEIERKFCRERKI